MKLDLINSRPLPVAKDFRVHDSIEGEFIRSPSKNNGYDMCKIAFNYTGPKMDYMRKDLPAPNIFDRAKIDKKGNFLEVGDQIFKKQKPSALLDTSSSFNGIFNENSSVTSLSTAKSSSSLKSKIYTPSLDLIKDKIYNPKCDTVLERIKGGKLPGASWSEVARDIPVIGAYTGENNLDKYRHERGPYGLKQTATKFNDIATGRGIEDTKVVDKDLLPIKIRRRLDRVEESFAIKEQRVLQRKLKVTNSSLALNSSGSLDPLLIATMSAASLNNTASSQRSRDTAIPTVKFSEASRFENQHYRQENYVKTSGMLLDNSWDKKFDKKLTSGFNQAPSRPEAKRETAGGDVDVDVGHLYSTMHSVKKSPVKYSAAFRSKAAVGMEIRPTTSPDHLGPGSFDHAYPKAIEIKDPKHNSLAFLRDRVMLTKQAGPEKTEVIKIFSEQHQSGPTFTQTGVSSGNVHMQNLVKTKMKQIYPRMASVKFPEKVLTPQKSTKKIK